MTRLRGLLVRDRGGELALRDKRLLILLIVRRETLGAARLLDVVIRAPAWSSLPYKVSRLPTTRFHVI